MGPITFGGGIGLNFRVKFPGGLGLGLDFLGGVGVSVRGLRGVRVRASCISKVMKIRAPPPARCAAAVIARGFVRSAFATICNSYILLRLSCYLDLSHLGTPGRKINIRHLNGIRHMPVFADNKYHLLRYSRYRVWRYR